MKTFDAPGKGRKLCPSCKKYVAARTLTCICGREFVKGETTTNRIETENGKWKDPNGFDAIPYALALYFGKGRVVDTPSGPYPIRLVGMNQEVVDDFCLKVVDFGKLKGTLYTPNAIKYFIREQYNVNSKKYKRFSELVDNWYKNLLGKSEVCS